jgi:indolepyruvate ferredoxin oxidoreductase alpha subunit
MLLSGNEAIARGAWEAGVRVGVGYPGTPSTETLQALVTMPDVIAQWAPNEKVALEVAAGVSMGGARSLVTMKHVGMNVASDVLMTMAYIGVRGGLVILVADDPGMHSSQNEQDSRHWGPFGHVPILEPADSSEALTFTRRAFEISEEFKVPVIVRSTTRISHSKGLVEVGERGECETPAYESDPATWVMMPGNARVRRVDLAGRIRRLAEWASIDGLDRSELRTREVGIITSGVCYQYVREALPDASVFKVGMSYPLPETGIKAFAAQVERLVVVEEADPFLATALRSMGLSVEDVGLPPFGELSPGKIALAFGLPVPETRTPVSDLPARPPLMCPGCPHRGVFYALARARAIVTGDIGCYTLGSLPPLSAMDSCVCMGASIGMAHGMELAGKTGDRPVVAVIGDSTFAHSGITGLVNAAYNAGTSTIVILDNRITAMTGHQGNPIMGVTLDGRSTVEVDIPALCSALGITRVRTIDPHDIAAVREAIREEVAAPELSVIIAQAPCALLLRDKPQPYAIDDETCTACGACLRIGCPAISAAPDEKAQIDVSLCVGCAQCVQLCKFGAIVETGPACDVGGPAR